MVTSRNALIGAVFHAVLTHMSLEKLRPTPHRDR
jgi:hypothetical protein